MADGIVPSNEGRGYVLRRILRRALRHGRRLGFQGPFLHRVVEAVTDRMSDAYPDLRSRLDRVRETVKKEEERFLQTLDQGLGILQNEIERVRAQSGTVFSGDVAFKLYDTYGFPLDLTQDILREERLAVDQEAYDAAMGAQRSRGRESWKGDGADGEADKFQALAQEGVTTEFLGYETLSVQAKVLRLFAGGVEVEEARQGEEIWLVADSTPFYGEAGGQVGDQGEIRSEGLRIRILDTKKPHAHLIVHRGKIEKGRVRTGETVELAVNPDTRTRTMLNHSATHLLHAALRSVVGEQVQQQGYVVEPERLRFDFSHDAPISREQIRRIESLINSQIRLN
ncbi:MAG: alanine--tRNA ligase-related protein, partial [Vicinamibacteria bacterium]